MSDGTTALVVLEDDSIKALVAEKGIDVEKLVETIRREDPEFEERPAQDQKDLLGFWLDQASKTVENVKSRFPMIAIRHGGTTAFELPPSVDDADGQIVREFIGIILDQYLTKAYWEDEDNTGSPPDCASMDAITPYTREKVSESCLGCKFAKWGSGTNGRGKRCRDIKRVIVKLPDHELPARLSISPSNLKPLDEYLSGLQDQGAAIGKVETKFRAVEARNKSGTEYTGIELDSIRRLPPTEQLQLKRAVIDVYGDQFRMGAVDNDGGEQDAPKSGKDAAEAAKAGNVM